VEGGGDGRDKGRRPGEGEGRREMRRGKGSEGKEKTRALGIVENLDD